MGILQARILEWVAMPFPRGSSQSRDRTQVSLIAGGFFTILDTREAQDTGVGSLSLLQGIFLTQESNWGLLHCRQIFYQLSYQGPLQGLNHVLLVVQLLIFSTSWKKFRKESRNELLCALGKTGRTGLQIVRYIQKLILWAQFLYLLISREALKSFTVMTFSWLAESFTKLAEIF